MRKNKFFVSISIIVVLLAGIVALVPPVLAKRGAQALQARDGVGADRYFAYAYLLNPWNKTFLEKRGQAQYQEGNFKAALTFYQRAYPPSINAQDYYHWLGAIEFALGNYPAALIAYEKAAGDVNAVAAMDAPTLNRLAAASAGAGNYGQARLFAQWAIGRAIATGDIHTEAKAYNNVGLAYARQGNYIGGENLLRHALSLWPTDPFTYDSLGELYTRWQKPDQALQAYEMALKLAPNFQSPLVPQLVASDTQEIAALQSQIK